MDKGTRVIAKDYRKRELLRVVWEDIGAGVLLCTIQEYERVQKEMSEPVTIGFPREDVRLEDNKG